MKAIILAAGQGTRLSPLTDEKPKCMVEYNEKPIVDYIVETMKVCGISDIAIVSGYKKEVLENHLSKEEGVSFYTNPEFDKTNMVSTLFCAEDFLDDDIIISYADIIYNKEILSSLISSTAQVSVIVDKKWRELWEIRMDNPLADAETLKLKNNSIIELGKKANNYDEIEGQYIGLIKISKSIINQVRSFYHSLDKNSIYDTKDFNNMYMTSFIQLIIDKLTAVSAVSIDGGWIEIDSVEDIQRYTKHNGMLGI